MYALYASTWYTRYFIGTRARARVLERRRATDRKCPPRITTTTREFARQIFAQKTRLRLFFHAFLRDKLPDRLCKRVIPARLCVASACANVWQRASIFYIAHAHLRPPRVHTYPAASGLVSRLDSFRFIWPFDKSPRARVIQIPSVRRTFTPRLPVPDRI